MKVAMQRCSAGTAVAQIESPVLYEGQQVARLRLSFDDAELEAQLADRRWVMAVLVACQVLFGVVVLAGVLSRRLLRPIHALKAQAGQLAAREPMGHHAWLRRDELGELGQHLNSVHAQVRTLIAELETKNEQLHRMAMFDPLTGLPNRTLVRELFAREASAARRNGAVLALAFIDLDHFKLVNDRFGHAAGDELLVATAARIRETLRESDLVCRVSGDEFLALMSCDTEAHANATAERVVAAVRVPYVLPSATEAGRDGVRVGASVGLALFGRDGSDFDSLMRAADVAMYRSKESGRGRSTTYHESMDAGLRERLDLERELRQAIERDELRLHFQPVVDGRSGTIVGCEALVRWQHPQRGLLPPAAFIEVAEACGLIKPLGRWVLTAACAQLARWHAQGLGALQIAVNVSALQLRDAAYCQEVLGTVNRFGVRPGSLTLELTESTLLDDSEGALRSLAAVRAAGVRLAVDDFGTGYSSLAALKLVRPERVKVDRGFVRDLPGSAGDAALVHAMLAMARALDIEVVAEGVETAEQSQWLLAHGCQLQQGWLWSRAVSEDDFAAQVRRQRDRAEAGLDPVTAA
jgi:diguanylate cyclase (GGDEF)-like protein